MTTIRFDLDYIPLQAAGGNARGHWGGKHAATQKLRESAYWHGLEWMQTNLDIELPIVAPLAVQFDFYTLRPIDLDSLVIGMKGFIDGLQPRQETETAVHIGCGLIKDDSQIVSITAHRYREADRTVVTITTRGEAIPCL